MSQASIFDSEIALPSDTLATRERRLLGFVSTKQVPVFRLAKVQSGDSMLVQKQSPPHGLSSGSSLTGHDKQADRWQLTLPNKASMQWMLLGLTFVPFNRIFG